MHFLNALSRQFRNRPAEPQSSKEYTGIIPQTQDGVQIALEPYTVAGSPKSFYEVSLTMGGKKLPISSVTVRRGDREILTTDIVEVPEGEDAYVLEVTDTDDNTYRCPEPIGLPQPERRAQAPETPQGYEDGSTYRTEPIAVQ